MTSDAQSRSYRFIIEEAYTGMRADKALSALCEDLSRSRIQALIGEGCVSINGRDLETPSRKLEAGDVLAVDVPPAKPCRPEPEDLPLNIVFEDEHLIVLNKEAGMVVHPGAGNWDGTLVNALLHHCGDQLSGIGGVARPGIVHRLDKDTSGLMVVAKTDRAHQHLSSQLSDRTLGRVYDALVLKVPTLLKGKIDRPIGRHSSHRLKMAVNMRGGRQAVTRYSVEQRFGKACALVECILETGRTHQIRVHMAYAGHPLIGDPLYGPQKTALEAALRKESYDDDVVERTVSFGRQALHARKISFIHPITQEAVSFETPIPKDMYNLLKLLRKT